MIFLILCKIEPKSLKTASENFGENTRYNDCSSGGIIIAARWCGWIMIELLIKQNVINRQYTSSLTKSKVY